MHGADWRIAMIVVNNMHTTQRICSGSRNRTCWMQKHPQSMISVVRPVDLVAVCCVVYRYVYIDATAQGVVITTHKQRLQILPVHSSLQRMGLHVQVLYSV
jgi:hypothetical protein